jgi:hypothetical protein
MLDTVNNLLATQKIPSIDALQMLDLLQHLFTTGEKPVRIQVAEVAYRYDHDHPSAMDVFLACTLPLAEKSARRRAYKFFNCPSDWQIELMYDGAVTAMITMFQSNYALGPGTNAFRRYLVRAIAMGTVRSYFMRQENDGIRTVANLATLPARNRPFRNKVEQEAITRELLNEVINFPHLRDPLRATLHCIAALGPHGALKDHAFTASGDPDKWERQRRIRPILDPDAIAAAMGTTRTAVHRNLKEAREILRDVFNPDGNLFMNC